MKKTFGGGPAASGRKGGSLTNQPGPPRQSRTDAVHTLWNIWVWWWALLVASWVE